MVSLVMELALRNGVRIKNPQGHNHSRIALRREEPEGAENLSPEKRASDLVFSLGFFGGKVKKKVW